MPALHKWGSTKNKSCPQACLHNIICKVQNNHVSSTIKSMAPAVQGLQKVEFEILKGQSFAIKIRWFHLFHGNCQRNYLPDTTDSTVLRSSSWCHRHIFDRKRLNASNAHKGKRKMPKWRNLTTMNKEMLHCPFLLRQIKHLPGP